MKKREKSKPDSKSSLVSFKISHELYEKLMKYAKTQVDEAGLTLSPSQGARRLTLEALAKIPK